MDIGIQSNLWGPEFHREKMTIMLHEIAQAGYAGIEIGAHRFESLDHPTDFLIQVQDAGLHVSGIHTLVKFYDSVNLDYARKAAVFTKAVGSQFMMVSGEAKTGKTSEEQRGTTGEEDSVQPFGSMDFSASWPSFLLWESTPAGTSLSMPMPRKPPGSRWTRQARWTRRTRSSTEPTSPIRAA